MLNHSRVSHLRPALWALCAVLAAVGCAGELGPASEPESTEASSQPLAVTIVGKGNAWKYLDTGLAPASWRDPGFDDSSWKSGPAKLGYGMGDEATVIGYGPSSSSKHVTSYFRRGFSVGDASRVSAVRIGLLRDDGAIVYLNGAEVCRSNMPSGAVGPTTLARSDLKGMKQSNYVACDVAAAAVQSGDNLLAVEVHQARANSPDLGFDLELSVDELPPAPPPPPPPTSSPGSVSGELIAAGSTWKYLDDGSDQGAAWQSLAFADSGWKSGAAQLGYGDGDEKTLLDSGASTSRFITSYFRRSFEVADASKILSAELSLLRDDGAVVYLNGKEVFRSNMPAGTVSHTTPATIALGSPDEDTPVRVAVAPADFRTGANVVAVEVHQASGTSSDVSFDLALTAQLAGATVSPLCGDGRCEQGETATSCPADCTCAPTTCQAQGKNCGTLSDGCGGSLSCGGCTLPESCGGGGVPNVCACAPTTCQAQGKDCGSISDGCGGSLSCGGCTLPETCGGGGIPNVCAADQDDGWVNVINDTFDSGTLPAHWKLYDGPYGSGAGNCAVPSHNYVSGGSLHLLMRHETSGQCGAGWYTGGMMIDKAFASVDQRVTVRFRVVSAGVRAHRIIPMRWPDSGVWPRDGEEDYCEGSELTGCTSFMHYPRNGADAQFYHDYTFDLTQWHTLRFQRRNLVVQAFIDDLVNPVWTHTGTSATLPETLKRVVLQQECGSSCPSGTTGTEDIQIDWITIDNPAAVSAPYCGDASCSGGETCSTCTADCGACQPACGDGSCSGTETCSSCAADCGACAISDPVVVAAGDVHAGVAGQQADVAALVKSMNPTYMISAGDLTYDGLTSQYSTFNGWYGSIKEKILPCPGNHDYYVSGAPNYGTYFGSRVGTPGKYWYSVNLPNNWHLVSLDSNASMSSSSAQYAWLDADLKAAAGKHIIAVWHHARYSSADHGDDSVSATVWTRLMAAKTDLVINGHDHSYQRYTNMGAWGSADPAGPIPFIASASGYHLKTWSTSQPSTELFRQNTQYGALKLTLRANSFDWAFVALSGQVLDSGTRLTH